MPSRLRPSQKPPERPAELTPETVSKFGWRDDPFNGPEQCSRCDGWGVRLPDDSKTYVTCARCRGTGRVKPPPTKGKKA